MGKYNKVSLEVNEDRMIVMYPDLYKAGTIGLKGIFRKFKKWFWGHSDKMSAPFFSPGHLDQNRR